VAPWGVCHTTPIYGNLYRCIFCKVNHVPDVLSACLVLDERCCVVCHRSPTIFVQDVSTVRSMSSIRLCFERNQDNFGSQRFVKATKAVLCFRMWLLELCRPHECVSAALPAEVLALQVRVDTQTTSWFSKILLRLHVGT
jgi:hypothetical protein